MQIPDLPDVLGADPHCLYGDRRFRPAPAFCHAGRSDTGIQGSFHGTLPGSMGTGQCGQEKSSQILCEKAMQIIDKEYGDPSLSLVGVSNSIHVSPNYLSALIKKETGSSFVDLLTKKRIETARELVLGSSMKMREIAERCGYSDQHYFSYCFKKYCGVSPNAMRQEKE